MRSLLSYILQVTICSGILYGYYHLALRNKKFHSYNRYYLLAAVIISIAVPFLNIPVYFSPDNQQFPAIQALKVIFVAGNERIDIHSSAHLNAPTFTWENVLRIFYFLFVGFIFARFLTGIFYIRGLMRKYMSERIDRIYFINTEEPGTPFSFIKWMFWNKKIDLQSEKGEQIFRHELFHIRQMHSWDIIFMELIISVFWINPFFYFIKKEISTIHEFLADEFAVNENDKWSYAELLLIQVLDSPHQRLVNSFFHNQIKRRIGMITSSKKPGYQYLRKLMVLPLATIVVVLFAFTYKTRHDTTATKYQRKEIASSDISQPKKNLLNADEFANINYKGNFDNISIALKNLAIKDKDAKLSGLPSLAIPINNEDTSKPLVGVLFVINGKERPEIKSTSGLAGIMSPNEIGTIKVLKGPSAISEYGEKGKNGVIEIYTKDQKSGIRIDADKVQNVDVEEKKEIPIDNVIFEKVEIDPSFPGGELAWRGFLERNLKIPVAAKNDAPRSGYTVWIEFIVSKEGKVSHLRTLTSYGYGMEEEALRLMRISPNWIPAKQNGQIVAAFRKQPLTFVIEEDAKENQETSRNLPTISRKKLENPDIYSLLHFRKGVEISSFNFTICLDNGHIAQTSNKGNCFLPETLELLKKAKPGAVFTLEEIRFIEDGVERKVPSLVYEIVD